MTVLDSILDGVREDLAVSQREVPFAELKARVPDVAPALDPLPAFRAPLILLMVASLDDSLLTELLGLSGELGLTALVEAHTAAELARAEKAGAQLIGVNARNLKTLEVDRSIYAELAPRIPVGAVKVAESGVAGPEDVAEYHSWGADVVLVGEALVRA